MSVPNIRATPKCMRELIQYMHENTDKEKYKNIIQRLTKLGLIKEFENCFNFLLKISLSYPKIVNHGIYLSDASDHLPLFVDIMPNNIMKMNETLNEINENKFF